MISFYPQGRYHWNFYVNIFIGSVSGRGGQEGGYLEDVGGSWPETWRTGSFLTSWMMLFYPKEDTLKILCLYLNGKCVRKGVSRRGVIGGQWGLLTRQMDDRVTPDFKKDIFLPYWRYPEIFVLICQREVCQEGEVRKGVLGGHWWFLTRDMDDRVIPDIMNDVLLLQGTYPESSRSIYSSAVEL